jgi:hypothetical protein
MLTAARRSIQDEHMFGFNALPDPLGRAQAAAQRAVALAPSSALASQALAQSLFFRKELDACRPVAERTIVSRLVLVGAGVRGLSHR